MSFLLVFAHSNGRRKRQAEMRFCVDVGGTRHVVLILVVILVVVGWEHTKHTLGTTNRTREETHHPLPHPIHLALTRANTNDGARNRFSLSRPRNSSDVATLLLLGGNLVGKSQPAPVAILCKWVCCENLLFLVVAGLNFWSILCANCVMHVGFWFNYWFVEN